MDPISENRERPVSTFKNLNEITSVLVQCFIIFSSSVYVVGYWVWANYAQQNHLGFLPAIREQYIVAGLIPGLLITALYSVIFIWKSVFSAFSPIPFNIRAHKREITKLTLLVVLLFIVSLAVPVVQIKWNKQALASNIFFFIMMPYGITYLLLLFLGWYSDLFSRSFPLLALALFVGFVTGAYLQFFSRIPREYGGPETIKVELDIKRDEISPQTLSLLLGTIADTSKVIRTKPVYLIFDEGDFMLFKQGKAGVDSTNILLKLKKESIAGIFDCQP